MSLVEVMHESATRCLWENVWLNLPLGGRVSAGSYDAWFTSLRSQARAYAGSRYKQVGMVVYGASETERFLGTVRKEKEIYSRFLPRRRKPIPSL